MLAASSAISLSADKFFTYEYDQKLQTEVVEDLSQRDITISREVP